MNKKNIIIFVFVVGFGVMLAGCGVKTKGAHEADRTPLVISEDSALPTAEGSSTSQSLVVENTSDGSIRIVLNDAALAELFDPEKADGSVSGEDKIGSILFFVSESLDDMVYDPIEFHKTGMARLDVYPYVAELAAYVNTGDGSYTDTESFDSLRGLGRRLLSGRAIILL